MRLIREKFTEWQAECDKRRHQLKVNEERLNQIFIDLYGLQGEVTPEIDGENLTVREADAQREIKSLISYAIGCIFGRYSVDCEGICYAGGKWDDEKYRTIIPDRDNLLPICDDDYFEDDLTIRIMDFVRQVYGEETLEENLQFIAESLGGEGTPKQIIRNYLLYEFYEDHCRIYHRRPIYWMFSSGKRNGFKALTYVHRWQKDTVAKLWMKYVHELRERYPEKLQMVSERIKMASASERCALRNQQEKLQEQLIEIAIYEEKICQFADRMIGIDFDDGVKVNYAKFSSILEKIR